MEAVTPVLLPKAGIQRAARDIGIGEENADCLERVMVRRGLLQVEEGENS